MIIIYDFVVNKYSYALLFFEYLIIYEYGHFYITAILIYYIITISLHLILHSAAISTSTVIPISA